MRVKIMVALMLSTFLAAMEGTIVSTAVPRITSDLSGFELVSWVYAIYMLATAVSAPIYGKLADLFGRKNVLLIGIGIFLLGSTLCGVAMTMGQLIVFRAIQGLGAGAVMPITMTIIGDLYTEQTARAKAQGWISAVWGLSGVAGPLVGGFLVDTLSWRYIFFLNLPFGLVSFFMLVWFYREKLLAKAKRHIDYPGALIFTVGTIALLYALLTGSQHQSWTSPVTISLIVFAAVTYLVFVSVEKKSPEPLIPLSLLTNRNVTMINMLTFLTNGIVISMVVYLPIWSQGVLGESATMAGFVLTPMPVCWTIGSVLSGNLLGKLRAEQLITGGTAILTVAATLLTILSSHSAGYLIYVAVGLIGLGMGLISPIVMVKIQASVPVDKRGTAVALNTFTGTFSQTFGAAVFGMLFNLMTVAGGHANLGASFETGSLPAGELAAIRDVLASGVHVVFTGALVIAVGCFLLSLLIARSQKQQAQSQ
ncbi:MULTISPECIES: MDR family MFS transporter [Brevibacillus]|uniref:MDR family MFS transporter n=1 Tax=Brevibacillus TaxID=55080 RepID=UPI0002716E56|nr:MULTISPECIES: MDR family MFS transporter [Brevibacillus]EJL42839.1 arabinose efflux permease family protein [Brevibacillus sp. CF112]MED4570772.1 MDR family MFS transporter [Brevibacillus agri]QHZ57681.1 MFS transporter [Brevibacillus sp. NSP2.1]WHX32201.1 MDR family MFS transporter [Brevibacillus agri]